MANGGLLTTLFGGPASGLLTPEQKRMAGKRALTDFGLSLLESSAPPDFGRAGTPLGAAIARGAKEGRASFSDFVNEVLGSQKVEAARKEEAQVERAATELRGAMENKPLNYATLSDAFSKALVEGDRESARILGPQMQAAYEAEQPVEAPKLEYHTDPDTGLGTWFDPATGQPVIEQEISDDRLAPALRSPKIQLMGKYWQQAAKFYDIPNSYKGVLSATTKLVNAEADAKAARLRGEKYIPPIGEALAAISRFARLLDPNSVVREGEFKIVSSSATLVQQVEKWFLQLKSGRIPADLAQSLQNTAYNQMVSQKSSLKVLQDQTVLDGRTIGIDARFFKFVDPFEDAMALPRTGVQIDPGSPEGQAVRSAVIDAAGAADADYTNVGGIRVIGGKR